jgi:hypothetical protein
LLIAVGLGSRLVIGLVDVEQERLVLFAGKGRLDPVRRPRENPTGARCDPMTKLS